MKACGATTTLAATLNVASSRAGPTDDVNVTCRRIRLAVYSTQRIVGRYHHVEDSCRRRGCADDRRIDDRLCAAAPGLRCAARSTTDRATCSAPATGIRARRTSPRSPMRASRRCTRGSSSIPTRRRAGRRSSRPCARSPRCGSSASPRRATSSPRRNPIERLQRRAEAMTAHGAALKRLADAAAPLYQSLDEAQKRRFAMLARFMRPRDGGGMMMHHRHGGGPGGYGGDEGRGGMHGQGFQHGPARLRRRHARSARRADGRHGRRRDDEDYRGPL